MRQAMVGVGVLWLAIIASITGSHELTLRTGRPILLETMPVDPRDLFRGDYVILGYKAGMLNLATLPSDLQHPSYGQTVYVTLSTGGHFAVPSRVNRQRPRGDDLYLKGRIISVSGKELRVAYGIESYFVPEGKGWALERARGKTLEVQAVADKSGHAVIKALLLNGQEVRFR